MRQEDEVPRERTGSVKWSKADKAWRVRISYADDLGKRRDIRRLAPTRTEASRLLRKIKRELEDYGPRMVNADKMTFQQLAQIYEARKLQPPVYKGDTKISGLRSFKYQRVYLKALVQRFGKRLVRAITHYEIEQYKVARLEVKTVHGRLRQVASVNRELQMLRAMLNFARREGWLIRNPFSQGSPLISQSDETRRDRVLSRDEEERLLAACSGPRAHLRPLLVVALDSGMRFGEIKQLSWADVDFAAETINIRATTTKTLRSRSVGMTRRVKAELEEIRSHAVPEIFPYVFGIRDNVKRSFHTACRMAGVENFRWHDTRHTAITRMIEAGMPPLQVMRISGHTQMQTFLIYLSADDNAIKRAAQALDGAREQYQERIEIEERIN
jgi:integrase